MKKRYFSPDLEQISDGFVSSADREGQRNVEILVQKDKENSLCQCSGDFFHQEDERTGGQDGRGEILLFEDCRRRVFQV